MRSTSSILAGSMAASLVAGPILIVALATGAWLAGAPGFPTPDFAVLGYFGLALVFSIPLGFLLGTLPILLGATAMTWIGDRAPETRSPILWALAGATLAVAVFLPLIHWMLWDDLLSNDLRLSLTLMVPGAACALICRRMTDWPTAD